jgi:hypothetical protein
VASHGSTVVEPLSHHSKVQGSSHATTTNTEREDLFVASNGSTVAEHLPYYYKVKGSSPATAANTERENK